MNQKGQVILVLLLIMTVGLAVGLSIVQRSVTDVSTSTKVEESARAFSAAEAGIERAARTSNDETLSEADLQNSSRASVNGYNFPDSNIGAFEISRVSQEDPGNVWLVNPANLSGARYGGGGIAPLDVYWGEYNAANPSEVPPAIEISVITGPAIGPYLVSKFFLDSNAARRLNNNFSDPLVTNVPAGITAGSCPSAALITQLRPSPGIQYLCRARITVPANPILLRARLIYTNQKNHPVAFSPVSSNVLPTQGKIFISTGISGDAKRTIALKRQDFIMPFFFDFVLFSLTNIDKN